MKAIEGKQIWQVERPMFYRYHLKYEDIPSLVACYDPAYLLTSPIIDVICCELPTNSQTISVELYIGFPDREMRSLICAKEYVKDDGTLRRFVDKCVKEYLEDEMFDKDWSKLARKIMVTNDGGLEC